MAASTDFAKDAPNARIENGCIAQFQDRLVEFELSLAQPAKCPLLSLGIIEFKGADSAAFINAQFTTDCKLLGLAKAQLSAWCDPKGRVLFVFVLYTDGESFFAVLPRTQIERMEKRLRMYVLRANVEIRDASDDVTIFGLTRQAPPDVPVLATPWAISDSTNNSICLRYGAGTERYWLIGPSSDAKARWANLAHAPIGEDAWNAHNCLSGLPQLDDSTSGQFVAQQLNLDRLDGLSFSKGCYPGQEIIARLKYRGEVKKRLVAARIKGDCAISTNSVIESRATARSVGKVVYAQALDSCTLMCAVIETAQREGRLEVVGVANEPLEILELPYGGD